MDMNMLPQVFGPPQYGSPDPQTSSAKLATLEAGHTLVGAKGSAAISEDYGADTPAAAGPSNEEIDATDAAKELAAEHGIDLSVIKGSGKNGRIIEYDVQDAIDASSD